MSYEDLTFYFKEGITRSTLIEQVQNLGVSTRPGERQRTRKGWIEEQEGRKEIRKEEKEGREDGGCRLRHEMCDHFNKLRRGSDCLAAGSHANRAGGRVYFV